MAAGDERIGETDEPRLLGGITWGLVRSAGRYLMETDTLRLPDGQRELEALATPTSDGLWWRRPPVDDDPAHVAGPNEPFRWIVGVDRLEG